MRGCARTDHFGCFGPCLNTIPSGHFILTYSDLALFYQSFIVYILGVTCRATRATRHGLIPGYITSLPDTLQKKKTFPPFSLLCAAVPFPFRLSASSA